MIKSNKMKVKNKLLAITLFSASYFMIFNVKSQCNAPAFTVIPNGGTCFSNASIDVQIPGASTCAGWTAILTKPDMTESSLTIPANGGPVSFLSLPAGNYNVRLFNGITTHQFSGNPFALSTTYQNMNISSSSTSPICPVGVSANSQSSALLAPCVQQFGIEVGSASKFSL